MTDVSLNFSRKEVLQLSFDYVKEPISKKSQEIFRNLISTVDGAESVLDIGCGSTAYFWALGYITNVQSVSFSDRTTEHLNALTENLNDLLKLDEMPAAFEETLRFLQEEKLAPEGMS